MKTIIVAAVIAGFAGVLAAFLAHLLGGESSAIDLLRWNGRSK